MASELTKGLKEHAEQKGIDLLGCTSASPFRVGEEGKEFNPRRILPEARSIVVAACYVFGFERIEPSSPGVPRGRFGPWTRASLAASRYAAKVVQDYLEGRGFSTSRTNDMPYKMAAVRSGIAKYGKNCIVHADGFGSYLKLAGVITNAELDCVDLPLASDCGECSACVEACPTGALDRPYRLDVQRCICGWLWGPPIPRRSRGQVGNYIFRCGYCQDVCPMNDGLRVRRELPFELEPKSDSPELLPLLMGGNEQYHKTLPAFVLEAGVETIRRNVAVALGNVADPYAIGPLIEALSTPHPKPRAAVAWALGRLGGAAAKEGLETALAREKDPAVREEISEALREIGTVAEDEAAGG